MSIQMLYSHNIQNLDNDIVKWSDSAIICEPSVGAHGDGGITSLVTSCIWLDLPVLFNGVADSKIENDRGQECANTKSTHDEGQSMLPQTGSVIPSAIMTSNPFSTQE